MEAFDDEWKKQQFEKLAPEVEAAVNRAFPANRGAKFGAQGAILAGRLAKLRTEIDMDAAKQKATITERIRQEGVSKQNEQERFQRQSGERARQESLALNERARARSQYEQDYARSKADQEASQKKMRVQQARDYFFLRGDEAGFKRWFASEEGGGSATPDPYDEVRANRKKYIEGPDEYAGPARGFKSFYDQHEPDNSMRGRTFSAPYQTSSAYERPDSFKPQASSFYNRPAGPVSPQYSTPAGPAQYQQPASQYGSETASSYFKQPTADYAGFSAAGYSDPNNRNRWSGDINENTPNEFGKFGRGVKRGFQDFYSAIS